MNHPPSLAHRRMIVFPLDPVRKEASSSPKEWDGLKVGAEGGRGGRSQPGGAAAPGGQGKSPQGGWGWGLSRGLRHLRPSRGREVVIRLHSFPAWGRKQVPSTVILEKVGKGAVTGRLSPVRLRADVRQTVVTEQERRAKLCPQDVDTARGGPRSKGSAVTARTRVWSR